MPKVPWKVLDAPSLRDDFYLNLLDWSRNNVVAVGLDTSVYLWRASSGEVVRLLDAEGGNSIASVRWSNKGNHLAVGFSSGGVQVWDVAASRKVRSYVCVDQADWFGRHTNRVAALDWCGPTLATGSRDHKIALRDARVREPCYMVLRGHRQEVCGLRWGPDRRHLASGGNDNRVRLKNLILWNPVGKGDRMTDGTGEHPPIVHTFTKHTAAIKAIAWSPHRHGLLASGGGTADKTIRFWNTLTGSNLGSFATGSQVCNLEWSPQAEELVSTHGYSLNEVVVWRYPSMKKLCTLTGHVSRVLFMSMSPDGQTVVTGAGDETLRFWTVFPPVSDSSTSQPTFSAEAGGAGIR